jgi:hypothetical protein
MNDHEKLEAIEQELDKLHMDYLLLEPLDRLTGCIENINRILSQKEDMDAYADELGNSIC